MLKIVLEATWSDSNTEDSAFTTSKDARHDPNDMLAFVTSMNDFDCDSDSDSDDDEFIDETKG